MNGENLTCVQQLSALIARPNGGPRDLVIRRGSTIKTFQVPPGNLGISAINVRASAGPTPALRRH